MHKTKLVEKLTKLNEKYHRMIIDHDFSNIEDSKESLILMAGEVRYFCEDYMSSQLTQKYRSSPLIDNEIKRIQKESVRGLEGNNYLSLSVLLDLEDSTIKEVDEKDSNALERIISSLGYQN